MHIGFKEFFFFFFRACDTLHIGFMYVHTQRDLDGVYFFSRTLSGTKMFKSSEKLWRYVNLVTANHLILNVRSG